MAKPITVRNADVRWDNLDPHAYHEANYRRMRQDDRQILSLIGQHFSRAAKLPPSVQGVDFGTGSNLYPALAMLPFCSAITLIDRSAASIRWLTDKTRSGSNDWDPFWSLLCDIPGYATVTQPWQQIGHKTTVVQADVLQPMEQSWGMGTMMFVAESITGDAGEFTLAIENFLAALRPGAPFAMAFMAESEGYLVADKWFPAVPVGKREIAEAIAGAADFELVAIAIPQEGALRENYAGMILALGTTAVT